MFSYFQKYEKLILERLSRHLSEEASQLIDELVEEVNKVEQQKNMKGMKERVFT